MPTANSISPKLLSDIFGAEQIGSPLIQMVEFGEAGEYDLGTVVSLDVEGRIVPTRTNNIDRLYGVIAEERWILELTSERLRGAQVIRRGSLKADELICVDNAVSWRNTLAPRLRELGIFLEGLEASLAAPFRIRNINPSSAPVNTAGLVMRVWVDGSVNDTAKVWYGGTELATTFLDFSQLDCTIANTGAGQGIVRVTVRQGGFISNAVNFGVTAPAGP